MESTYVGAYWGNRPESAKEGAERLAHCRAALARVDEALASWYKKGASRTTANTPVASDSRSLAELLERGRNRTDVGREVIQELGFSFDLWNRSRPEVGLNGLVGAYPSVGRIVNTFVLSFYASAQPEAARIYTDASAKAVMKAVVEAWEPDWATWSTSRLRDAQPVEPREPVVGWYTYLRGDVAPRSPPEWSSRSGAASSSALLRSSAPSMRQRCSGCEGSCAAGARCDLYPSPSAPLLSGRTRWRQRGPLHLSAGQQLAREALRDAPSSRAAGLFRRTALSWYAELGSMWMLRSPLAVRRRWIEAISCVG